VPRTSQSQRYPNNEVVVYKICPNAPNKGVLEGMLSALA
jgi:hypothetical protein